jgi:hypothetical protein
VRSGSGGSGIRSGSQGSGVAGVPAGITSPDEVAGLELWTDFSDLATITTSSGRVTVITDKTGNGHNLNNGAGSGPTSPGSTTQNGLNVSTFNGSTSHIVVGQFWYDLVTSTTFVVLNRTGGSGAQTVLVEGRSSAYFPLYHLQYETTSWSYRLYNDAGSSLGNAVRTVTPSGFEIVRAIDTGSSLQVGMNGVMGTAVGYTRGTFTDNRFCVGRRQFSSPDSPWTGHIGEILIYDSVLSAGDITLVEDYLTAKWGL